MSDPIPTDPTQRRALQWTALLAVLCILYVVEPLGLGLFLGALFAFMAQPVYARLRERFGGRIGALVTVAVTTVVVLASIVGTGWLLASKGVVHAKELVAAVGPDAANGGVMTTVDQWATRLHVETSEVHERLRALAEAGLAQVGSAGATVLSVTASGLLVLFFMMLTMHFVLRNSDNVIRVTTELLPLKPEWTVSLFAEFRRVGRTTLFGTLVTGFAQGVLATLGYWFTGVPDPLFFGVATALASLIPAVGTLLVWVPIGVVRIASGHLAFGVVELVWGALVVVGVSDYVVRPRLVGGESELPSLLTFAGLFGGVEVFGLKGLIVGPVLLSLAFAVLGLYVAEVRASRGANLGAP